MGESASVTPLGSRLPDGWNINLLGPMCTKIGSGATPRGGSASYVKNGIAFIRSQNVFDHRFSDAGLAFIDDNSARRLAGVTVESRDVLLNITGDGETIARCCVVPERWLPARVNQHVVLIRTNKATLVPEYLQRYLSHPLIREYMLSHNSGGSRRALTKAQIEQFKVVVPPLSQQEAISEVLGALDNKIVTNQNIARTSDDLMKALYERSIRLRVTTTSIGKTADVFDGPHATPNKTHSGPWFLSISSLKDGRLVLSESAHLSEADFQRWTRRVVPLAGDVLFSYETRLGEAALMPPGVQACLGRRMALLRPRNGEVGPRTLLQAFLSKSFQSLIRQRAIHGATVDRIPLTSLPSWPIDLPTDNTRQLEDVLSSIDDVASSSERENERLADLRDTLLPRLMSGEIRVRDAERIVEDAT
jgi:type I restriction enzyme, S subunit